MLTLAEDARDSCPGIADQRDFEPSRTVTACLLRQFNSPIGDVECGNIGGKSIANRVGDERSRYLGCLPSDAVCVCVVNRFSKSRDCLESLYLGFDIRQ